MRRFLLFPLLAGCAAAPAPPVVSTIPAAPVVASQPDAEPEAPSTIYVRLEHRERSDDIEVETSIPILSSPDPALKRPLSEITSELREMVTRNIARLEKTAAESEGFEGAQPFSLHISCMPALLSVSVVSITCDGWQYYGGAHGVHGTTGHNYLITKSGAEAIELDDILEKPDEGTEAIAHFATGDLREQGATLIADGIVPKLEERYLQNFTFTPDGLVFHFAPYIVGSYAEGDYEVMVDYSRLAPLLRRGEARRAIEGATSKQTKLNVVLDFEAKS